MGLDNFIPGFNLSIPIRAIITPIKISNKQVYLIYQKIVYDFGEKFWYIAFIDNYRLEEDNRICYSFLSLKIGGIL
jgi:hypothetical protein